MSINKSIFYLVFLFVVVLLYAQLIRSGMDLVGILDADLRKMVNKCVFAIGLLAIVYGLKIHDQCGLIFKARWSTLPIYWPLALIALLTILGGVNTETSLTTLTMIFFTMLAVGIGEELMFRGLVFYWFSNQSVRQQITISAVTFGLIHLTGLRSDIAAEIILAQVYFATALGFIFAIARAKDVSIMLPILIHFLFDLIIFGSKGGVKQATTSVESSQIIGGLLFLGTVSLVWGLYLLWKTDTEH